MDDQENGGNHDNGGDDETFPDVSYENTKIITDRQSHTAGVSGLTDFTPISLPAGKVHPGDMYTVALMFATAQRVGKPRK